MPVHNFIMNYNKVMELINGHLNKNTSNANLEFVDQLNSS